VAVATYTKIFFLKATKKKKKKQMDIRNCCSLCGKKLKKFIKEQANISYHAGSV
jgi:hypothetical protein